MKIQEMHIGQKVRDIKTKFEFEVVVLGINELGDPYVIGHSDENGGDFQMFKPEELEEVK